MRTLLARLLGVSATVLLLTLTVWAQQTTKPGVTKGSGTAKAAPAPAGKTAQAKPNVTPNNQEAQKNQQLLVSLLAKWEQQSKVATSLTVKFKRIDNLKTFKDKTIEYEGQAHLKSPDFAYIDFYEVLQGKPPEFRERIVCNGKAKRVYQFTGETRQVAIFPLPDDQQNKALQEGPLPFLFNMSAEKAKQRYKMELLKEQSDAYVIGIRPRLEIDQEEYSQALILLDKEKFQPLYMRLIAPNEKDTKSFDFRGKTYAINAEITPAFFDGEEMTRKLLKANPPWDLVDNTDPSRAQQPKQPAGAQSVPAGQPARRPGNPAR